MSRSGLLAAALLGTGLTLGTAPVALAQPMDRMAPAAPSMAQPPMQPISPPVARGTMPPPGAPAPVPGTPMRAPDNPFSNLQLPRQSGVGDGAYNGGGVVLEHAPDGSLRLAR
ncbi:hypothetical protein [Teichococcus oryzae]|uniref:Uncharacterized protein n=1 Tax=Teichococcus oryzae TaxID=1608942 RepID=A0A5B2THU5_9PROT|nr:hypothetical protein [Pseudoroseomonas oryzae]KAA2213674.1 hypothetical protein F0Q34_06275 [Pseudoroseomonas oryzae]